ncbi:MAG: hypothetical protein AAB505_00050, partial [Patescibacteria group bacterium]
CGNFPTPEQSELSATADEADATGVVNKSRDFILAQTGGGSGSGGGGSNAPTLHTVSASVNFDPVAGHGDFYLGGKTIVVERINSYVNFYPDKSLPRDVGYFEATIDLEGSFIPADGTVTEAMEKLLDLSLFTDGLVSFDQYGLMRIPPGCENGEEFNLITGEKCPWQGWEIEPRARLSQNGYARLSGYQYDDQEEVQYFSDSSFHVYINGGTITSVSVNVYVREWEEEEDAPDYWLPIQVSASFRGVVTLEYEEYDGGDGGGVGIVPPVAVPPGNG